MIRAAHTRLWGFRTRTRIALTSCIRQRWFPCVQSGGSETDSSRIGVIQFDIDEHVSMIFVEPVCAFLMPRSLWVITPVWRIQTITFNVISAVDASHTW